MSSDIVFSNERLVEAARYALLRRLLPAICHNLAGSLQPIRMMATMLERRIKASTPDFDQLAKNSQALNALSRESAATTVDLMTWLAPKDNNLVAINSAIEESLGMMSTELSIRGFSVVNQTTHTETQLPRSIIRSVFMASLIALTDRVEGANRVTVNAEVSAFDIQISIELDVETGVEAGARMQTYRALNWSDVTALAEAEGVCLSQGVNFVRLNYLAGAAPGD